MRWLIFAMLVLSVSVTCQADHVTRSVSTTVVKADGGSTGTYAVSKTRKRVKSRGTGSYGSFVHSRSRTQTTAGSSGSYGSSSSVTTTTSTVSSGSYGSSGK